MAKQKEEGKAGDETRLVRFDADFHAKVQLEVPVAFSTEEAKKFAERSLKAAIERACEDRSVVLEKTGNDAFLDPRGATQHE